MSNLKIDTNHGQAAGSIENHFHAIPCPGQAACPFPDTPESKRQADFYRDTGIWAPAGARVVLEWLMRECGFTAPRLRIAWQANNLVWDDENAKLLAKIHWLEPAFGYSAAGLMAVYFVLQGGMVLLSSPPEAWRGLAAFLTATVLYGGMTWMAFRYVLVPYRVAKRVKGVLLPGASGAAVGETYS